MNRKKLRLALRSNAVFSLTSGALMVLASSQIAQLFEINQTEYFAAIGAGLIVFAVYVLTVSFSLHLNSVKSIIWGDWGWVIGSIVTVLVNPFVISEMGKFIMMAIAAVVALFALIQMKYGKEKVKMQIDKY